MREPLEVPSVIDSFSGQWKFLSNFYLCPFEFDGRVWSTGEHAFQALKSADRSVQEHIRRIASPSNAKREGRTVELRTGWDRMKVEVMRRIIAAKFALHSPLATRLMDTETAVLIEGNDWGDRFWGVCRGVGSNHLGLLLMERRGELVQNKAEFDLAIEQAIARTS